MTYTLRFLAVVEEDSAVAAQWYDERQAGLGDEFLDQFYDTAVGIVQAPTMYRIVEADVRRCILRRFPYSLYFTVEQNVVLVIGLLHCARDPRQISQTVRGRPMG